MITGFVFPAKLKPTFCIFHMCFLFSGFLQALGVKLEHFRPAGKCFCRREAPLLLLPGAGVQSLNTSRQQNVAKNWIQTIQQNPKWFSSHDLQRSGMTSPGMGSPAVCCCSVRPHKSGFSFGPDHLSHVVLVAWCLLVMH